MTNEQITSIGNFLTYYRTDLIYINNFQRFKNDLISYEEFLKIKNGGFYSFTVDFRIVRNFPKGTAGKILDETNLWVRTSNSDNVDLFATKLRDNGLTMNKTMTSLASKILFLNNPWKIIPMDRLARSTLGQKTNKYGLYTENLIGFKKDNESEINEILDFVKPLIKIIHREFEELGELDKVAKNRVTDKLLWTLGK